MLYARYVLAHGISGQLSRSRVMHIPALIKDQYHIPTDKEK